MGANEDPKLIFARADGLSNTLRTVGITKDEREITRIIIRSLSDDYDVEKRGVLLKRDITRFEVEEVLRTRYAARQQEKLQQPQSTASSSKAGPQSPVADPHALAVGGFRGGGGRNQGPGRFGHNQPQGRSQGWGYPQQTYQSFQQWSQQSRSPQRQWRQWQQTQAQQ